MSKYGKLREPCHLLKVRSSLQSRRTFRSKQGEIRALPSKTNLRLTFDRQFHESSTEIRLRTEISTRSDANFKKNEQKTHFHFHGGGKVGRKKKEMESGVSTGKNPMKRVWKLASVREKAAKVFHAQRTQFLDEQSEGKYVRNKNLGRESDFENLRFATIYNNVGKRWAILRKIRNRCKQGVGNKALGQMRTILLFLWEHPNILIRPCAVGKLGSWRSVISISHIYFRNIASLHSNFRQS